MDVFSPQRQSCPTSLRSSLSTQNHLPSTLRKVFSFSIDILNNFFVRSHDTEETCKGVKVRTDASDSWFDTMSDIFTFSWSAPLYFGQFQPFFCTLMAPLVGSQVDLYFPWDRLVSINCFWICFNFVSSRQKKAKLDPKSDCYCLIRSPDYIASIARYLHVFLTTLLVRLDTLTSHRANNGSWVFLQPGYRSHEKARHETATNNVEL